MNILFLRFLVIFYVCGVIFLLFSLITANVVKKKQAFFGLLFFPVLLLTSKGRAFLKEITKG
jgi:hypothetical protein